MVMRISSTARKVTRWADREEFTLDLEGTYGGTELHYTIIDESQMGYVKAGEQYHVVIERARPSQSRKRKNGSEGASITP